MEAGDIDITVDIIIPSLIIAALFVINGIILYYIFKKRQLIEEDEFDHQVTVEDTDQEEEPSTSRRPLQPVQITVAGDLEANRRAKAMPEKDESFELRRL